MQLQPSFFLKYKNKFGDHSIDAFAGVETRDIHTEEFSAKDLIYYQQMSLILMQK